MIFIKKEKKKKVIVKKIIHKFVYSNIFFLFTDSKFLKKN